MADSARYSDSDLASAIAYAKELIDDYCGTSFGDVTTPAYDAFSVTLTGTGSRTIQLKDSEGRFVLYPQTIAGATIDGTPDSDVTYAFNRMGVVYRDTGTWSRDTTGVGAENITITGTAGKYDDTPERIAWAARAICKAYLFDLDSQTPDRALNLTTPDGSFEVRAQAGGPGRPTNMPDVNAVLNRYREQLYF